MRWSGGILKTRKGIGIAKKQLMIYTTIGD